MSTLSHAKRNTVIFTDDEKASNIKGGTVSNANNAIFGRSQTNDRSKILPAAKRGREVCKLVRMVCRSGSEMRGDEHIAKLPQQLREWLYIAACDPEPEYQAMMQTVTEESEREWLVEIRAIFADAREAFS